MLRLYRAGLAIRREAQWGPDSELGWLPSSDDVLAFARGERFACIVNFGPHPVELPTGADVLVASDDLEGGALPQDTTAWVLQAENQAPLESDSSRAEHSNGSGQRKEGR